MQSRSLEILVGFFFALGVAAIFVLTFRVAGLQNVGGGPTYELTAMFENIGGLKPGASVTLAGVKIGRVRSIAIDRTTFEARVKMDIAADYDNIPKDSNAKILTAGLLGEQYIGFEPGGALESLEQGDTITFTQSALVLENLIGQFLTSMTQKGSNESKE